MPVSEPGSVRACWGWEAFSIRPGAGGAGAPCPVPLGARAPRAGDSCPNPAERLGKPPRRGVRHGRRTRGAVSGEGFERALLLGFPGVRIRGRLQRAGAR